jgi:hypothetical protein
MGHFRLEEWADFARDVMAAEEKEAMQSHLDNGCKQCAKAFGTWKHVREAARREASYLPPEGIVRTVKAMGVVHAPDKARPVRLPLAQLLFDSFSSPLAAGVRSTSVAARQLLYGSGDYRMDLRIEPQEDSDKVSLSGQILNSANPDQPVGVLPVILRKGEKVLAESLTNKFGEFQLDFELEGSLQLHADLPQGQVLQIRLVEPVSDGPRGLDATDTIGIKRLLRKAKKSTRKKD